MASTTNYLVTGAARGIGRGLVASLATRPDTIVVATVRDTAAENARSLAALPTHASSRIVVLKLDSSNPKAAAADGAKVVADLVAQGINHLDVVVANAGIAKAAGPAVQVSADDVLEHLYVNTLGPLLLFQAVWPDLLSKSAKPIFVGVSTGLASIGAMYPMPFTAYPRRLVAVYITQTLPPYATSIFRLNDTSVASHVPKYFCEAAGVSHGDVRFLQRPKSTLDDGTGTAILREDLATQSRFRLDVDPNPPRRHHLHQM
ncbi:hypothetical protein HK405_007879 [Cladochytrium tenue]|nr:hypothetical protein HK405_007879 [Cladochytrium tenue]